VCERTVEAQALYELAHLPGRDAGEAAGELRQAAEIFASLQAHSWQSTALAALADIETAGN